MTIRSKNIFTTIRTEGAILPADLLQRVVDGDKALDGLSPTSYHLLEGEKLNEAINRSWSRLRGAWVSFKAALEKLPPNDPGTSVTRDRLLLPLFQELGYGRLTAAKAIEIENRNYPISHGWLHTPIHLVGWRVDLDRRTAGVAGAARSSPHSLVQELLNRSQEHLWAFLSNGRQLRILRDNVSLTRQAYVEFDLEAMMAGEVYADFVLLWLLCHQSRVETEKPEQCWLEKWSKTAQEQGTRALDQLRRGVEVAIATLGQGFLSHPVNRELRQKLQSGQLSTQDYYRQLLRLVYRLLFLFVAEDRGFLLDPKADVTARERYILYYSTARLRTLAEKRRGTRHADLFFGLRLVMEKLGSSEGCQELGLPALGSLLWSEAFVADVVSCQIANADLLEAIRALAFIRDKHGRRPVDYKNLRSEELGSVYEALLELHPELNVSAGTFALTTAAGNERKTTGSYYTPESLVQCLLDSALDPVVDEAIQQADPEAAILNLKLCDPACGSGHFLIAAAHRMAKRLAAIRTGDEEPSPEATQKALRDVIGQCIYGVDVNPMAVELCKVALWMESLEPGKPLSFLEHHIQCGNSLLGATPALLRKGIPDEAFTPIEGDDKAYCSKYKKQNKQEREKGQLTLLDERNEPWERLGDLATSLVNLNQIADDDIAGVQRKQTQYEEYVKSTPYLFSRFWADAWCAAFVWKKRQSEELLYPITDEVFRQIERNPFNASDWMRQEVERLRDQYKFFHWHLAFPNVFQILGMSEENQLGWCGGFDVVLGNPPFINAVEFKAMKRIEILVKFLNPLVKGSADLAFYFFEHGLNIVNQNRILGLIQPRPILNSPAALNLRKNLRLGFKPNLIYAPNKSKLFSGALVFTCILVVGNNSTCYVSRDPDPFTACWVEGIIKNSNWWFAMEELITGIVLDYSGLELTIYPTFEVFGSMTTAEAYELKPFIIDEDFGSAPKLVTTGLIDPYQCFWGERQCRYLGVDYKFPRIAENPDIPESLKRRLKTAQRPKILVAGLSRKIECFIDLEGSCIGAKSTFTILHPQDNLSALQKLCDYLLSPVANQIFISELGANAVGGGDIVMKKSFLQKLNIPQDVL
jgi:hypothetical protein